ncbi:mobile mystery protein A [Zhongshania marina]|uniref:Mobile mystery protein A n=1 Tax=Zhongshania marina TaxID=2304603 RepID=A0ABX9W0E8_9GAMM|nr:mobile mystery protein A [Zhongshania marina]
MSVKQIVNRQYREQVNKASSSVRSLPMPKEGWIRTVRKALGMSGAQLGRKMGKTRAAISNIEKAELSGGVTIAAMEQLAEALGCRFVYAIVPEAQIEGVIEKQAEKKAEGLVRKANQHMALEAQSLESDKVAYEVDRLKQGFIKDAPADLWND